MIFVPLHCHSSFDLFVKLSNILGTTLDEILADDTFGEQIIILAICEAQYARSSQSLSPWNLWGCPSKANMLFYIRGYLGRWSAMKLDMPSIKKGLQKLWNHAAHQLNHHYPSRSCSTIFGSLPVDYASNDDVEKYDVLWCIYLLSFWYFSRQSNLLINLSDPQQLCLSKFPWSIKIENNGCRYFRHGQGFRLRVSFENLYHASDLALSCSQHRNSL